jgi:hypothetical protein
VRAGPPGRWISINRIGGCTADQSFILRDDAAGCTRQGLQTEARGRVGTRSFTFVRVVAGVWQGCGAPTRGRMSISTRRMCLGGGCGAKPAYDPSKRSCRWKLAMNPLSHASSPPIELSATTSPTRSRGARGDRLAAPVLVGVAIGQGRVESGEGVPCVGACEGAAR